MRIRWLGLELPGRVVSDDAVSTESYARFTIEPFEQGFGTTIGNSLRRVLLSSLEGAAVTSVKIAGVAHEFATMEGVLEDVADILLNIKGIVVALDRPEPKSMSIRRDVAGEILARDIEIDPAIRIINPEHRIATLTADVLFDARLTVERGRGYRIASENRSAEQEIGVIPVDSVFSPVLRVRYRIENMRVGQRTNYDRLILEVWTDGTIRPKDALMDAGLILRKHLNPFVMYGELGKDTAMPTQRAATMAAAPGDAALDEVLDKPVAALKLSVRASNCLDAARVVTLRDLVSRTEQDLLRVRSFGKTSLHEVQHKLADIGLSLGMEVDGGAAPRGPQLSGMEGGMAGPGLASPFGGRLVLGRISPEPIAPEPSRPPAEPGMPAMPPDSGPMAAYTMED
ncbi:MAG: DNA-directed RNA polymerase subunit alpha [Planctomycetes bacterium]|nr:DNA-directed RNA polymerase subunit alpha [Planctomycetota bacterium]